MSNRFVPRRFGEHKAHGDINQIPKTDLRAGDILIAKEWSWFNSDFDVKFVRTTQAVFSHVKGGSSQSEHVLINVADGQVLTVESIKAGLWVDDKLVVRDHVVYGCIHDDLRREASRVAEALSGRAEMERSVEYDDDDDQELIEAKASAGVQKYQHANPSKVKYRNPAGLAASVFRSKHQGHFANKRIERLYEIVYGNDRQQVAKAGKGLRMICSEFVASCYEVAALRLRRQAIRDVHPFGVGVDPRALTAKAMEAVLQRSNTCFLRSGAHRGDVPIYNNVDYINWASTSYTEIQKLWERRMSAEECYRVIQTDPGALRFRRDSRSLGEWKSAIAAGIRLGKVGA